MRILGLTRIMRLIRRHLAPPPCGGLHCSTLQHTATHCNLLRQTAVHCNTLQQQTARALDFSLRRPFINGSPTARHCKTLQDTARYCNATPALLNQRPLVEGALTSTHCSTLQHTAKDCNRLQQTATDFNRLQQTETECITLQHNAKHFAAPPQYVESPHIYTHTCTHAPNTHGICKQNQTKHIRTQRER